MLTSLRDVRTFRHDERGVVAVIFGLILTVVMLTTGLAVDFARIFHVNSKIGGAIDAAALAAAKGMRLANLSDAETEALAQQYFAKNFEGSASSYATIQSVDVKIDRPKSAVQVDVQADVQTLFGRVAGIDKVSFPSSSVAIFEAKDIEVGLQLDVTGSMAGSKLASLKAATKDLVDILIPDSPTGQKVRIGYAPFSAGVNAGSYATAVNGGRAGSSCTYERRSTATEATDVAPIGGDALKIRADLTGPVQGCPAATILPMTDDKALLKATVDGYRDGGSTAGQLGTAWAWYLISPNWSGVWPGSAKPEPYRDGKTIKVAVLMTDGIYNTIGGVNYGDASVQATTASNKARSVCAAMRGEGIVVYTVGFQLPVSPLPTQTLSECASGAGRFFRAEDGAQLRQAFRAIAEDIASLRLSK